MAANQAIKEGWPMELKQLNRRSKAFFLHRRTMVVERICLALDVEGNRVTVIPATGRLVQLERRGIRSQVGDCYQQARAEQAQ
jgi:hypothetical protein